MKIKKFLFPLLALLIAVGGAFATQSVNRTAPITVWFEDVEGVPASCRDTELELEPCLEDSDEFCIKEVLTSAGPQDRVIYTDATCTVEYERPENP